MKKLIAFSLFSFVLTLCVSFNAFALNVKAEYLQQVTISGHKLHIVITKADANGIERVIATGTVYTHAKVNEQPGAMYNGDSFITDADSPGNVVAALKNANTYDAYTTERDAVIRKQIISNRRGSYYNLL